MIYYYKIKYHLCNCLTNEANHIYYEATSSAYSLGIVYGMDQTIAKLVHVNIT